MNDAKEELELAINELKWVVRDLTDAADKKISDRRRAVAEMRSRCRVCRNEAERVLTALAITIKLLAEQRIEEGGK